MKIIIGYASKACSGKTKPSESYYWGISSMSKYTKNILKRKISTKSLARNMRNSQILLTFTLILKMKDEI